MFDFSDISNELLRDYLIFIGSSLVLLLFFITYLLFRNYVTTRHVEAQIRRFNLSPDADSALTRKLYNAESKLLKYGLMDPRLQPLERILDAYAVTVTDNHGVISYANDSFCQLSGYRREELVGQPHTVTASGLHDAAFWSGMWNDIKRGKVWHAEIANRHKNGELYWLDTLIIPLSLITEKDVGYISLRTDVTHLYRDRQALTASIEQKERQLHAVEGILIQSEKMASMGMLAAGVAHEINNPVAYIAANTLKLQEYLRALAPLAETAAALAQDPALPSALRERLCAVMPRQGDLPHLLADSHDMLTETIEGIERVKKIVSDLKSFTHSGNDIRAATDIHQCIESALNVANNEIKYKARVVRDFGNLPPVHCNASQIGQVILNLLVNAAQAIEKNGTITVTTRLQTDNHISIAVADTGSGMTPEILERLFEPFFTTKPVGKGTGIGLPISNDIIVKHRGRIAVASTPGVGTTFTVLLPLATADAAVAAA